MHGAEGATSDLGLETGAGARLWKLVGWEESG